EVPPAPIAGDALGGDEAGHDERRVRGEGRRHHRGAGEPPRRLPAGEKVLVEALAAAAREVEADDRTEDEVGGDDRPVDRGQRHGGTSGKVSCVSSSGAVTARGC